MIGHFQGAQPGANMRALRQMLEQALEEAQLSAQQLSTLRAEATQLPEGSEPTVQVQYTDDAIVLHIGIPAGASGAPGIQGKAFTYADFTSQQLEDLRGPIGKTGPKGEKGDAFTYDDFTSEQLEDLRGPEGKRGIPGDPGQPGAKGDTGVGIRDVYRSNGNGRPGETDTYVIELTDGSIYPFYVYNGRDGDGAVVADESVFLVKGYTEDGFSFMVDKTLEEIYAAHVSGKFVFATLGQETLLPTKISPSVAEFMLIRNTTNMVIRFKAVGGNAAEMNMYFFPAATRAGTNGISELDAALKAYAYGQGNYDYLLRNSSIVSYEETPSNDGEICWKYE